MKEMKGVTIYFNDDTKLVIEYPKQFDNNYDMVSRLQELLENKYFLIEAEGSMLFIPVDNIKYLQVYPAPEKLPAYTVRGASIIDT